MAFKMKGHTLPGPNQRSPIKQDDDVPRKKIVAPMEGAENTYDRKKDPTLKKEKVKRSKEQEKKRIAEEKETDRLIREDNYEMFLDKQRKDNLRSDAIQRKQDEKNKALDKELRRRKKEKERPRKKTIAEDLLLLPDIFEKP
tara:strand:+ start:599 stop:1024 length:426 start_codon:yes stop_codon:yes gene_type:complete